jgi:alpha-1,2-mannosyltransferase
MAESPANDPRQLPLRRGELLVLIAFLVVVALFAVVVEHRSAFQQTRKGDLNVFLRAAWAVRADADLYAVTDDNGFHYHYPPLLAILAAPLADAPAGADRTGMLPYSISVAVCYLLNLFFLAFAVHRLARALERTPWGRSRFNWPVGSRGWWALRMTPIFACIIPIGHTLSRGQVNLLLLALFAGFLADLIYKRHFRAGLWLAGAICIKIIPAYLLLLPLWRRDGRCLAGCAVGLFIGLIAIPGVYLGPTRTVECYREMTRTVLLPGLGSGNDASRAAELTNQTATEGQSILTALHNTLHYDPATRPSKASAELRLLSYLIGGLLTVTALFAFGWRQRDDGLDIILLFGLLTLNMLLISPVCHLHYFSLLLPLVMGLAAARWQRFADVNLGSWLMAALLINGVLDLLPQLPDMNIFRDCGSAMYGSLIVWAMGAAELWRRRQQINVSTQEAARRWAA